MKPALCLALAGLAVLAAPARAADDVDPGRALYEARCGGCHALAADRVEGRALYEARCGGCHALAADRVGPRHAGVLGRKAGSIAGFAYSPALARSQIVWTEESLERWLRDPEALVPGQRMNFRVGDADERRRIVEYLSRNR